MGFVPRDVGGLGIDAKVSDRSQIIFKNYLVEFQEEGGRTSLGGRTSWDKGKVRKGER
jgi:hypothetical protein